VAVVIQRNHNGHQKGFGAIMPPSSTALITGASSGVGAVCADRLARRDHDLILVARDEAQLQSLAERIRKTTGRRMEVLRRRPGPKEDSFGVEQRHGDASIGLLVNNAGIVAGRNLLDNGPDHLAVTVALNMVAPHRFSTAAAKSFATHVSGTVIDIAAVLELAPERFKGTSSGTGRPNPEPDRSRSST
jgi:short-subunit dehydrogenase